ncbi:MAG: HDOD domain-containing protein [bacterium]
MSEEIFQKILSEHKELSSLPQTLAAVLDVVRNEDSTAGQLADVIIKDPAMTAKILRIVNSPYYGGRDVTSVRQAVMTLGLRAVSALALSTSVYDMSGKWQVTIDRNRFWRHSLQVALAARDIASAVKYPFPEEAFVCGLLHDIGILVMEKSFPGKFDRLWKRTESGEKLVDLEDEIWGTNHARVGQFLLEQWKLPEVICEAVGMHHSGLLTQNKDQEFRTARIVALANSISNLTVSTVRPELAYAMEDKQQLCRRLDLPAAALGEIEQGLMSKTLTEARFLEIEVGSEEEILMEANRLLYQNYLAVEKLLQDQRRMQQELARGQMERAALDAVHTIAATFNHYINNAAAAIMGRAQLVEVKLKKGEIIDLSGDIARSMQTIVNGVNTVCSVLEELKNLTSFNTTIYHDDTYIIDLEDRIKKRLQALSLEAQDLAPVPGGQS